MALRGLLYVMMALGLAGFLGVGWIALQPPAPPPPIQAAAPPPVVQPRVAILTAAHALRAGALLVPEDITTREVEAAGAGMDIDTPAAREAMLGGMIRQGLAAGAPLHGDNLLRPRDHGFLAAVLDPGMLAVSIGVDPISGAAGLIWPDDLVDVVLTQANENGAQPPARRVSGETILAGVRVIAIDQQLMQGNVGAEGAEHVVRTVTLEVTSAQAERIAVGARLGHLSLAVHASRAAAPDDAPAAGAPPTAAVTPAVGAPPAAAVASAVAAPPAAAGAAPAGLPSVTWAGDVSSAVGAKSSDLLRVYSGPDKAEEMHF